MAKQKQQEARKPTAGERLGLRVSAMINSPIAQLQRRVTIHRLDTDPDEAWSGLKEMLRETDGLVVELDEGGSLRISWERPSEEDVRAGEGEVERVEEMLF